MDALVLGDDHRSKGLRKLGFRELISVGTLLQENPLQTYVYLHETYGDLVFCPWIGRETMFIYHPDHIRQVLKDNHANYHKSTEYAHLKPLLGEGLLTSEDELWRNQRKIMARQFHQQSIDQYLGSIQARTLETVEALKRAELHRSVDISQIFSTLTFEIAGEIFFGANVEQFSGVVARALDTETERIAKRIQRLVNLPMGVPTRENLAGKAAIKSLDTVVEAILEEEHSQKSPNVLTKLLAHSPALPKKLIRDEVMTLLLAGHETTSNSLTWTSWFLGRFPAWQETLRRELLDYGKKAGELTREDLPRLKNLRAVINESLRLMPPIPAISRVSLEEDTLDGHVVPKGVNVVMYPWVTHRDRRWWNDPLVWSPERFLERAERRDDFTFFPFARGARSCIGEELAMVEASIILAHLVESFEWRVSAGFAPRPQHHLTLRSENGMWLNLKRR